MAKTQHLANAPIREAIFDIQFVSAVAIEAVDSFAAEFASADDKVTDLWTSTLELKVETTGVRHSQVGARVGKRVDLADGKHIVQFRSAGVTFSRLHPYDSWEVTSEKALNVWHRYFEVVKPSGISRVAARFINSIEISLPITDFSDYLTYAPDVPSSLPQTISNFLSRVEIVDPSNNDVTNVTQTLEGWTADAKGLKVLLDIDAAHLAPSPILEIQQLPTILKRLRETKNNTFFGFLKEKALEPYL